MKLDEFDPYDQMLDFPEDWSDRQKYEGVLRFIIDVLRMANPELSLTKAFTIQIDLFLHGEPEEIIEYRKKCPRVLRDVDLQGYIDLMKLYSPPHLN